MVTQFSHTNDNLPNNSANHMTSQNPKLQCADLAGREIALLLLSRLIFCLSQGPRECKHIGKHQKHMAQKLWISTTF